MEKFYYLNKIEMFKLLYYNYIYIYIIKNFENRILYNKPI